MKITFDPHDEAKTKSGIISRIAWENAELQAAIRKAFHESEREQIVTLEIDREGITAVFESLNELEL